MEGGGGSGATRWPYARVECVVTEHDLLRRIARPVRLIVIHGVPPFSDPRLPARLRHALGDAAVSIVVVTHSREPAWQSGRALIASGQVEDIIYTDTERVDALVAAWSLDSDRCRQKVEAMRHARESAPENLPVFLEELLLKDTGDLSAGARAARTPDGSRSALHRELAKIGVSPSTLVDMARVLNVVSRILVRGGTRL